MQLSSIDRIVVSFSGGRTSAYMLRRLLDEYSNAHFTVVFANTGRECRETLDFIEECSRRWNVHVTWIEAVIHAGKGNGTTYRITDYLGAWRPEYVASRLPQYVESEPHPFEAAIAKYGIPNRPFPWCSRELKMVPIAKFLNEHVGHRDTYEHAMGIRVDEDDRAGDQTKWYPLVQWRVTKRDVRQYWDQQPFDLGLADYAGNCDLCWKKTLRKNLTVIEENPRVADWWHQQEELHKDNSASDVRKSGPHHFHHLNLTTQKLVGLVERGKFQRSKDEHQLKQDVPALDFGLPCDCGSLPGITMFAEEALPEVRPAA